jgi:hypothetical protein
MNTVPSWCLRSKSLRSDADLVLEILPVPVPRPESCSQSRLACHMRMRPVFRRRLRSNTARRQPSRLNAALSHSPNTDGSTAHRTGNNTSLRAGAKVLCRTFDRLNNQFTADADPRVRGWVTTTNIQTAIGAIVVWLPARVPGQSQRVTAAWSTDNRSVDP